MTQYQKITRTSQALEHVCLALLLLLPIYLAHHWLLPTSSWIDGMPWGPRVINEAAWPPSALKQLLGIAITFVPGAFLCLVLLNLRRLFGVYASGEFFSSTTVYLYSRIAGCAFWFVLSGIAAQSALSVLLSFDTDFPHITLTFSHTHVFALLGATLLRVVTWIMAMGHEIQSENQSFV